MGTPNGRAMHKADEEIPFDSEINFHLSESSLVEVRGSDSGESRTVHHETLAGIVYRSIKVVIFSNKLNLLMPFGPLAILVQKLTAHLGWVFAMSLLGIMPLAERLGYATEQLAFYSGDTVGGLLNATFGNATEFIISVYALKSGMTRVVQLSLLGSILSNMLLVLGCAFLCGGIVNHKKEQVFNKATASVNSGLLLMVVMGLCCIPIFSVKKSDKSLCLLMRCVDEVIPDVPWVITNEFLDKHQINYVAHDSLPYVDASGGEKDVYEHEKWLRMNMELKKIARRE